MTLYVLHNGYLLTSLAHILVLLATLSIKRKGGKPSKHKQNYTKPIKHEPICLTC